MGINQIPQVARTQLNDEPTNRVVNQLITAVRATRDYVGNTTNFIPGSKQTNWTNLTILSDFTTPNTIGYPSQTPQWRYNQWGQIELRGVVVAVNTYAGPGVYTPAVSGPPARSITEAIFRSIPEITNGISAISIYISGQSINIGPFINTGEGYSLDGIIYDLI